MNITLEPVGEKTQGIASLRIGEILKILKILIQNQGKAGEYSIETCRGKDARHRVSTNPVNPDCEAPTLHRQKHLQHKFFLYKEPLRKILTRDCHHSGTPGLLPPFDLLEN